MKKRRAAKKMSPLLSVLIVVFCLLVFFGSLYLESQPAHAPAESAASSAPDDSLEVHFLDIGQGDSALLFCGEETMLVDGGRNTDGRILLLSRQLAHEGVFRRRQICGRAGRLRHHPEPR